MKRNEETEPEKKKVKRNEEKRREMKRNAAGNEQNVEKQSRK